MLPSNDTDRSSDHKSLIRSTASSSASTDSPGVRRGPPKFAIRSAIDLLAHDGLTPLPLLVDASGGAARGMFVSLGGVVTESLPRGGAEFVRRFARTQAGAEVEPSAVYAAQAADVVLDAIARSDGTRASVLDELFRTRVRDGLLGDFTFDRRGDITESPITILRLTNPGSSRTILSMEGGVVERVARPSVSLVSKGG